MAIRTNDEELNVKWLEKYFKAIEITHWRVTVTLGILEKKNKTYISSTNIRIILSTNYITNCGTEPNHKLLTTEKKGIRRIKKVRWLENNFKTIEITSWRMTVALEIFQTF